MKAVPAMVALAAGALLLCGCRSFEKDWDAASVPPSGIEGRWVGTWQNTNNNHGGPLRAVLVQEKTNQFRARFHAGWGKRSGSFRTRLKGEWTDGTFHFRGKRRILFVPIRTDGTAAPDRVESTYDSPFDRGTFRLRRPE